MKKVTNNNALPYSMLMVGGAYAVIEAGETKSLDVDPSVVDEYLGKGFDIEAEAEDEEAERVETTDDKAPAPKVEPKAAEPAPAAAPAADAKAAPAGDT